MKITLYEHPFAPVAPQVFEAGNLAEWLLNHYGDAPSVNVQIFKGEPCASNEISHDLGAIMANDADVVILQSPGGLDPITWAYIIVAVVVVAAIVLTPKPQMPGNINRTQQSPNNQLGNRENKLRMLERVEDIYGTVKSIPSLMMPTYNKYIDHLKYEYGYYCVGRGYYDIAEVRDGDTLISEVTGASAAIYDPFTSPNSGDTPILQIGDPIIDDVLTTTRAIEVDGITLKASNQVQLVETSADYTYIADGAGDRIEQAVKNPNFNSVASVGDSIVITMSDQIVSQNSVSTITVFGTPRAYVDDEGLGNFFADVNISDVVTFSGFSSAGNNGTFTVTTKPDPNSITVSLGSQVNETASGITISETLNYTGSRIVAGVNDGSITLTTSTFRRTLDNVSSAVLIASVTNYTDWVTLPDEDRTEVWCNVIAPNGMFKDNGGKSPNSTSFEIQIEKLDADLSPLGVIETVAGSLSGATSDERADTIEHATAWTGPARVRMRRTTDFDYDFDGTVVDEIKWADLYSVSPVSKSEFGNKTTIHTITQATARATAVKSRQLNCIASRKLPIYDGSAFSGAFDENGLLAAGTISATSKIVDIIAAVSVDPKIGRRDLATEIDMAQIWSVQQELDAWNEECGQFNYTFDSDNMSFEESIVTIANAAFCIAYRQNGKIRLALDRAQANSSALFTHRNKKPNAETITRTFSNDADYDGVEFVYVDTDSNQPETITLPLDGSYTKLKKYEIAGIRSFDQAWLRANREYYKLIGQRISIETTTTLDARALLPNARVDIVDNTRFKSYDGEVIAQNGLELTLSQDVTFTPSVSHSIVLMKRDGSLQSIPITAGSASNKVLLQSLPAESLVTTYGENGIRTIFSFAADSAREAQAYLVQEIDISDPQYVKINAINYSDDYYQMDEEEIPARDTVIN